MTFKRSSKYHLPNSFVLASSLKGQKKFYLFSFISVLFIVGCSPRKPVDRTAYDQEREVRELKRLTKVELMAKGEEIGKQALSAAASALQSNLKKAISEKGVAGAIGFCNLNASGIVKPIEDSLGVTITRVTDKTRNPADSLKKSDLEIWEAYTYSAPDSPQLMEQDEQTYVMTQAIKIPSGLCLNCHGTVGEIITEENYALIKELYPADSATGYHVGDLRGMWKIVIPKKSVVARM